MCRQSTAALILIAVFISQNIAAQISTKSVHNIDTLITFRSKEAIASYFTSNGVPFEVLSLKQHQKKYQCLTAYPYSGSDTIDVYMFVHHGEFWRVQMIYFSLNPKGRDLAVKESRKRISLTCEGEQLIEFYVKQK